MNSVSKIKIAVGYTLLVGVLLFSLFFLDRETKKLMLSGGQDVQWVDSLMTLLKEKDANTIRLLRTLSQANDSMISTSEIENIIAQQDTIIIRQRVQQRMITHRDTIVVQKKKKSFFRRLGEVFSPSKEDTAIQIRTATEYATDTVIDTYNPVDSLQQRLKAVTQQRKEQSVKVQRRKRNLQRLDHLLNARIDSLVKGYEQQVLVQARQSAAYQQEVRHRSVNIVRGIAVGAVLLAALFLVLILRDVTRSNRYKRELEEARRRAEDLLATRERLMLAITHDFKAPLGSIIGYADLLSRLTVDERQRFYLENMKTSSQHLLKLVVDLLDFHRLDLHKAEVNRVSFHPARLLEEIRVSFEPLTSAKGLKLEADISPKLEGTFICDPLRLRQIINNLLSNAVKFTDQGGITLKAGYEDGRLVVSVTDTGKGMEPADCKRIFQEFTRLPGAQGQEGFGLGLSIVRMLVQLLEGTITVQSRPGQGSTFTLQVPIYPVHIHSAEQEKEEAPALAAPSRPLAGKRILLIDDDRIQLMLTVAMLHQAGAEGVPCQQVDELLEALRQGSFDVLLTDVQMPAINGFDLLKLLRASNIPQAQTLPVIAVTARSDVQRDELLSHGFAGCLHKPFTVAELSAELSGEDVPAPSAERPSDAEDKPGYDFAALTAFSVDDSEAAHTILQSFADETRLNLSRLQRAADGKLSDEAAAVAHKMIPLFTLIKASATVSLLKQLEMQRGMAYTADTDCALQSVIQQVQQVLSAAESLLSRQ